MTFPVFPLDKLPYPVRDNYKEQYQSKFKRTGMDDGQGRVRRSWASQPMSVTLMWRLTWTQYASFEAFLRYDCAQGGGYFTIPLFPGATPQTIRFLKYPAVSFNQSNGAWELSGEIEYLRAKPDSHLHLSALDGSALFTIGGDPIESLSGSRALPIWPDSLPEPEKSSYSLTRDDEFIRSSITDGLAQQRARFQTSVATYQAIWLFDAAQRATFDAFVHDELYGGLGHFQGPFVNGLGAANVRIRFIEAPVTTSQGACYQVVAKIETTEIPFISRFDWEGLGNVTLTEVLGLSDQVRIFMRPATLVESFTLSATVTMRLNKVLVETIGLTDNLTTQSNDKRTTTESVAMTDSVNYNLKLTPKAETVALSTSGSVAWNDYIDGDYIADDYIGTTSTF